MKIFEDFNTFTLDEKGDYEVAYFDIIEEEFLYDKEDKNEAMNILKRYKENLEDGNFLHHKILIYVEEKLSSERWGSPPMARHGAHMELNIDEVQKEMDTLHGYAKMIGLKNYVISMYVSK